MTNHLTSKALSRRTALAGLGAGTLGAALAATSGRAIAQDATPIVGHPLLGTWVIIRDLRNTTEVPAVVSFTSDGSVLDPGLGAAGSWEPTGPNSAAMTIIPFLDPAGGYVVVRGTWDVDASGDAMTGPASVTVMAPGGAVVATDELSSSGVRLKVEPIDNGGQPIAGFPVWTAPSEATPGA